MSSGCRSKVIADSEMAIPDFRAAGPQYRDVYAGHGLCGYQYPTGIMHRCKTNPSHPQRDPVRPMSLATSFAMAQVILDSQDRESIPPASECYGTPSRSWALIAVSVLNVLRLDHDSQASAVSDIRATKAFRELHDGIEVT